MAETDFDLPLFPLQTVLFPEGRLALKVFEARYLDLISRCLRTAGQFGIVALRAGAEVQREAASSVQVEDVGCTARVLDVDAPSPGILHAWVEGVQRFECLATRQVDQGLWMARARWLDHDDAVAPLAEHARTVEALRTLWQGEPKSPRLPSVPTHFEHAGWVANRWCERLPVPLAARQALLALNDPHERLRAIDRFLAQHGVVGG